jgi:hypothetical protein
MYDRHKNYVLSEGENDRCSLFSLLMKFAEKVCIHFRNKKGHLPPLGNMALLLISMISSYFPLNGDWLAYLFNHKSLIFPQHFLKKVNSGGRTITDGYRRMPLSPLKIN